MVSRNKTGPILKLKLCNSVNKLLFARETFLRGSRETFHREYLLARSSPCSKDVLTLPNITGLIAKTSQRKPVYV